MITNKLLDDVLKVIIDHTNDQNAYVGDFELIHSQEIFAPIESKELVVNGKKIEIKIDRSNFKEKIMKIQGEEKSELTNEIKSEYQTSDGVQYIFVQQ